MDLERFRPFLTTLARILLDAKLRSKFDASDIVQHTLMDAFRQLDKFRGSTDAELKAWLKTALLHDMLDLVAKFTGDGRNVDVEIPIHNSSRRLADWLSDPQTSPSSHAARKEEVVRLAEAFARLPEDQRTAVELHLIQEYSLKETAQRMGKSFGSVASLIHRGVEGLRKIFGGNGRA